MKCNSHSVRTVVVTVAPHGGAWIEIEQRYNVESNALVAPHGGAWIEITKKAHDALDAWVAPHGGAWIEIRRRWD